MSALLPCHPDAVVPCGQVQAAGKHDISAWAAFC